MFKIQYLAPGAQRQEIITVGVAPYDTAMLLQALSPTNQNPTHRRAVFMAAA